MSKKLDRLANASANSREDKVFAIFAYLNTRNDYNPLLLTQKAPVSAKTIYSYLKQIQDAQLLTSSYCNYLTNGFDTKPYSKATGKQLEQAKKLYTAWLKRIDTVKQLSSEKKQQLLQYQFINNYVPLETLYTRLDQSLLIYSYNL